MQYVYVCPRTTGPVQVRFVLGEHALDHGSSVHAKCLCSCLKAVAALSFVQFALLSWWSCASSSIRYVITFASATKMNINRLNTNSASNSSPLRTTIVGQHRQHARHSTSWGSYALDQDTRRLCFVQHNRRTVGPSALRAAREDPRQHWRPRGSEEYLHRDKSGHIWLRLLSRALPDLSGRL